MKGTIIKVGKAERMPNGEISLEGWHIGPNAHFTPEELLEISQKYELGWGPLTFPRLIIKPSD